MKQYIEDLIKDFVREYPQKKGIRTTYKEPLVGYADADSKEMRRLKDIVIPDHQMPADILENPTVVISYFIPFTEDIGKSNEAGEAGEPSRIWALAYDETNEMMAVLNQWLIVNIEERGYHAAVSKVAGQFSKEVLKSKWSQRHIARLAGLGTFGINNMLITEKGCCGRYNSVVTNLPIDPDVPLSRENCIYKHNKGCKVCVSRCTSGALKEEYFDRFLCYESCSRRIYGNDTCGKCVVNLPCTSKNPVKR